MNKRESKKERRRKNNLFQWLVPVILFAVIIVVIGGVIVYNSQATKVKVVEPQTISHPNAKDTGAGDPNAKVKVFVFEDFQCPNCGVYSMQLEPIIMQNYVATGKVYYQFVPFSFIGPESVAAAEASYCANEQGKFWEYHDYIFANQNGENQGAFNNPTLVAFAEKMGLNMASFNDCLSTNKYSQKVKDDKAFAVQSGATGSPYFLVNSKLVGQNELIPAIESELTGK